MPVNGSTLLHYTIMVRSVIIEWQIHVDNAYRCVYCSTKRPTLSLKGISQLLIKVGRHACHMDWTRDRRNWSLTADKVQKHPYPQPEGFEWACIHREIYELYQKNRSLGCCT